jgi:cytoskeletal protein RodZ
MPKWIVNALLLSRQPCQGRMPPRAYAVGYLRAYAAAVGLDADDVVLRFEEAAGPAVAARRRRRPAASARTVAAVVLAGAVAAGVLWTLLRS